MYVTYVLNLIEHLKNLFWGFPQLDLKLRYVTDRTI